MYPKWLADIIRWGLIIATTFLSVEWLWNVHWVLGLVLAVPAYLVFLNLWGFLTLPLYMFTIETWVAAKRLKELETDLAENGGSEQEDSVSRD